VVVRQPDYIKSLNKILTKYSVDDWKNYLTFKTLSRFAGYLNHDFVETSFEFYGKTVRGIPQIRPRWKRGVSTVEGALGEVLGRIYVGKYFKPEAKERMKHLVDNLIASYGERLKKLDWMSEETKQEALKKLSKFTAKIGYPDKWRDYSGLQVKKDDLIGNVIRSDRFDYEYNISKLGKPVDRTEWGMYPQTVNAYYNPSMNEVVFPAAILQPPFFNMEADDAVNYGAIGAVIGHELTHGFDDQGSKSDGDGNLRNWWTKEDRKRFEEKTAALVRQYSSYVPIDTFHLNGKFTLGENIADLGGVTIAYEAYHRSLNGKPAPVIDGFTGDQRFFIGWAQVWKRKYRADELRKRIFTDPHSPSEFRANGVLVNFTPFYRAFNVKEGDKMYKPPQERIVIW
ncbi:MAG TPA: M13 family peptidase, partial [Caldithrix abyssi]|nr:M13 family peptidase [Caldithrix abyssi]